MKRTLQRLADTIWCIMLAVWIDLLLAIGKAVRDAAVGLVRTLKLIWRDE
jgi:hypothetical protein